MIDIEYRKMTTDDLNIFIEMRINQLQEEGAEAIIDLKPHLRNYYERHLDDNTFVSWLAIHKGQVIGTSGISFIEKPPYYGCPTGKIALISSMYTLKSCRRQGIAKALLNRIMDEAKAYGCATVQITASDMGIPFYESYGFKRSPNFLFYTF